MAILMLSPWSRFALLIMVSVFRCRASGGRLWISGSDAKSDQTFGLSLP